MIAVENPNLHAWDLLPDQAAAVQSFLRQHLSSEWDGREVKTVGGVDVAGISLQARSAAAGPGYMMNGTQRG